MMMILHQKRSGPKKSSARGSGARVNQSISQNFYTENEFLRYYSVRSPTRVNTERLAEREMLLHHLGSKLNRTVLNSCGNPIIRSANNT